MSRISEGEEQTNLASKSRARHGGKRTGAYVNLLGPMGIHVLGHYCLQFFPVPEASRALKQSKTGHMPIENNRNHTRNLVTENREDKTGEDKTATDDPAARTFLR